ncbi:MAG: sugar isomerase [Rhodospirillales bacterium]|nr:sugar isomerase [Rhodospirillales bacterium]
MGQGNSVDVTGSHPMLADMRRQPQSLAELLARAGEFAAESHGLSGNSSGRVYAFGSGDGWFAARAATDFARKRLGLRYKAASALEMLAYAAPKLGPDDLAIAISMSGTADRTNEAAEAAQARSALVLALTNGSGGNLAKIAQSKISLELTDVAPFLTGTAKYTASLLGLMLLLQGAAGRKDNELAAIIRALPALVSGAETFAGEQASSLAARPITGVRILSSGCNLATADYGTAKFLKLVPLPITADDIEEFAHRQFWSTPADDLVIYIAANPAAARCASASAAALGSMGMRTIAIDTPSSPVATAGGRFSLPDVGEAVSPLLTAIPVQFLSYFIALTLGGNPDIGQDVGDPARFLASQRLARRGELGHQLSSPPRKSIANVESPS